MFDGFDPKLFEFLHGLEANNSKTWFDAHRSDYEWFYKNAAEELVADISQELSALGLKAMPKVNGSLRRINRDVRFSKDKSPYHAHMHLVFWSGDHPNRSAGMHFVIKAAGIGYGAGHYGMNADILTRYRAVVCDESKRAALQEALAAAKAVGSELEPPALARVPKGFEANPDWEDLLKHKSIVARTMTDQPHPAWLTNQNAKDGILDLTKAHLPLIAWLRAI
ncbi:TIGR02453 family protein [Falsihalocynthiibacter sp. SS001]|uniref:TIGR02453 family protein n=1 Tax=Falsihalocynthiibacter sp. SS001 TaxID=3349698 RepID=UPI0036D2E2F0